MRGLYKYVICCAPKHPVAVSLSLLLLLQACATYYQANYDFNRAFERGDLEKALRTLRTKSGSRKTQFLDFVNNGLVLSMLGRYEESNDYFEKAFLYGEDYRKQYLYEAASFLTNPTITPYRGEDHEHLMLLYYKALNYLKLKKHEAALVECRRLNIRLQQLSDRFDDDDKYRRDAFIHNLMGIIYDSNKDYNNAFIAYRNAYDIYVDEYDEMFSFRAPEQLKHDLLRTAWLSGFREEFDQYKASFGMENYQYQPDKGGELVFFWHNGLSPVKVEWGINFAVVRKSNVVEFSNQARGMNFTFPLDDYEEEDRKGLEDLELFRVAFPKYVERPVYFSDAEIMHNNQSFDLQLAEDVNKVAFKVLEERMVYEMSKALIRAALKKVAEHELRKSDKALGSVLGMINAITEKADTRNWQTLPHSIYYVRIPLREGENQVQLKLKPRQGPAINHTFTYYVNRGQTLFHTFTSLESSYPEYQYY